MFCHAPRLQYEVRVDTPDPLVAERLQQAIGGMEGEIRVQSLFQAWATPPSLVTYRDMRLHTGTEETSHVEMLCTAVALNLDGGPAEPTERMEPLVPEWQEPPGVTAEAVETVKSALS